MTSRDHEPKNRDRVKRFLDWVNADENLPGLEEQDDDQERVSDEREESQENKRAERRKGPVPEPASQADPDELTESYAEDDEFEYPDEILGEIPYEAEQDAREAESPPVPSLDGHDTVPISKRQKRQMQRFRVFYLILSAVVALNVIIVMLVTVSYLPPFGAADNPAVNEVYLRYVERGLEETGAPNLVAAVLYSYRSFDTLGEAIVLFTAAIGVISLMREPKGKED